ncbi:hypothetical protein AVEN_232002-1, partial [Araneus ventricosus]
MESRKLLNIKDLVSGMDAIMGSIEAPNILAISPCRSTFNYTRKLLTLQTWFLGIWMAHGIIEAPPYFSHIFAHAHLLIDFFLALQPKKKKPTDDKCPICPPGAPGFNGTE